MSDLNGRVCLVTGATRGIGRATAEALAKLGATVLIHGRDSAAVGAACRETARSTGNSKVSGVVADLSSLAAVRGLADEVRAQHSRLHVLVNNAGLISRHRETTVDGFERQIAVNHLAPFLLTSLLRDRLEAAAPARVVTVASNAHRGAVLDLDDLNWERRKYSSLRAYGASKLANILFTRELARRIESGRVTANCLHPGVVATNIFSALSFGGSVGRMLGALAKALLLSPADGAKTSVYLASSPDVAGTSGKYFAKCRETAPTPAAQDDAAARRLWEISENLTGLAKPA